MIVSITGHRARDLDNQVYVSAQLRHAFHDLRATHVIQGMCDGADLIAAHVAEKNHLPFTAVRPWAGHSVPEDWKASYAWALDRASHVEVINESEIYPGPQVYHARNHWMVDRSAVTVAVWDGKKYGGTYATIQYAQKKERPIWHIDPKKLEVGWLK